MGLTLKALKKLHRDGRFQPSVPQPARTFDTTIVSHSTIAFDAPVESAQAAGIAHVVPAVSARIHEALEPAPLASSVETHRAIVVGEASTITREVDHSATTAEDALDVHERSTDPPAAIAETAESLASDSPPDVHPNPEGETVDDAWSRLLARSEPEPQPAFFVSPESPMLPARGTEMNESASTLVLGSDNGTPWRSSLDALQFGQTMVLNPPEDEFEQTANEEPARTDITSTTVPLAGLSDLRHEPSADDESADAYAPVIPPLEDELPDYLAEQLNNLWKPAPTAASPVGGPVPEWDTTASTEPEVGPYSQANGVPAVAVVVEEPEASHVGAGYGVSAATVVAENERESETAEAVPVPRATMYEARLLEHLREGQNEEAAHQLLEQIRISHHSRLPSSLFCCSPEPSPRTADVLAELAMLLSEGEEDVLLVDANLGDQTLTRAYELIDTPGLCDVLNGQLAAWEIIRPTSRPHVWMVPAGDDTRGLSRNGEPIRHEVLSEILKVWQYHFHRVLVDVGSMDATTASPFARVLDASLMVVPQPDCKLPSLRQAAQHFKSLGSQPLGCVITDAPAR